MNEWLNDKLVDWLLACLNEFALIVSCLIGGSVLLFVYLFLSFIFFFFYAVWLTGSTFCIFCVFITKYFAYFVQFYTDFVVVLFSFLIYFIFIFNDVAVLSLSSCCSLLFAAERQVDNCFYCAFGSLFLAAWW